MGHAEKQTCSSVAGDTINGQSHAQTAAELSDGEYTALTSRVRSSRPVSSHVGHGDALEFGWGTKRIGPARLETKKIRPLYSDMQSQYSLVPLLAVWVH